MPDLNFTRREALSGLGAAAAFPLLSSASAAAAWAQATNPAAEAAGVALLDSIFDNLVRFKAETATTYGFDKGKHADLRSRLDERSGIGQQRYVQTIRADLARANAIDTSALSHATRTSIEVVRSAYATAFEGFTLPYGDVAVGSWRNTPYVVIQNAGAYLDIPRFLDADHQIDNAADAEAYLARLADYPRQLDNELGRVIMARYKGLIPPDFLIDKTLEQLKASAKSARDGGGLVESIVRRTREKKIPGDWESRARAIATREVAPALERQIAEYELQRPRAKSHPGMWAQPNGDEYYRWALKASTTTTRTPDEIHQIGVDTLRTLHAQMDGILKKEGYSRGSVGARMKALLEDPRYRFANNDKGRAEVIAFIYERIAIIRAKMPEAFNTLVRANLEVRRLPPEEEPGAPDAYGGAGSADGTVPGKFWINLKPGFEHTRFDLPSLTHHETIPGHVWQGDFEHKLHPIRALLSFNSYSEGWGLYAEQLADELDVYEGFEVGRLGYLKSIAFRTARLVIDTGLHAKRWSREQARQYFLEAIGDPSASEVDRYCSWPGQACGYEMGHQEIHAQRERARSALGPAFDLKTFNDAVLLGGNVPMDVLAKNVEEYVATAKGSAA